MYSYLEGKIEEKNPAYLVIDCNGLGYLVNISLNTYARVKNMDRCRLLTHLAIKNEATTPVGFVLYGFFEDIERQLFRQLISVSGVGFNTAILILSSLPPDKLIATIADNNAAVLQTVKGIGAKSAQRIIIDLRDKIEKGKITTELIEISHNTNRDEALSGLTVLGFNRISAQKALDKILKQRGTELSIEELIKEALKIL